MNFGRLTHLNITQIGYLSIVLMVWLLTTNSVFAGQVYKYVDKNGKVHYSDHPLTYRQENFSATDNDRAYNPNKDTLKTSILQGNWALVAHSKHLGNDTLPSYGHWQFTANGTLHISKDKQYNKTEYRAQNHSLEVLDNRHWKQYRIVSLSQSRLVIHTGKKGEYLYFNRSQGMPSASSAAAHTKPETLYRRDQVAKLMTMFTCTGIKFSELTAAEKTDTAKEIFNTTGIEHFDETIYTNSVAQYGKDAIFNEQYQPKIQRDIKNCKVPKFDTN